MRRTFIATVVAGLVGWSTSTASAQVFVTPQFGGHFGGGTIESRTLTFGASAGAMVKVVGFEVDFGFSQGFFPETHPSSSLHVVGDLSTVMANVVVGTFMTNEMGGPYISGGIGTLRILADEPNGLFVARGNDLGYNVGAGAIGFFNDRVGVRGDVRYFRDIRSDELVASERGHHAIESDGDVRFGRFGFWRATAGVTFRF